ncbi:CaiB/BaiF CoA transferase family protein [Rhizobium sp. P28RR-XV]|uniref:CaiB/BaiF CoA transferase family protein n=1 Tax=Rhizobium sp. P28RR-XV TaxID=2726737 RepID=UPI00145635CA|nr:CoA transferase [Rhizobium sp. P28RR-XV]NLR88189.1 CoA transferase [Rhizobium sp. P28RR-XV]
MARTSHGPLTGLRILEIGHFIAAPFATRLLADLGAEVIKVEPPSGDPVRQWGKQLNGASPWWSLHGRNKKSITLNLKHPKAIEIVLQLAACSDALVENFRPGHLGKLGLSEDALRKARQDLVIARITGFGQDGPYRNRAAFGVIGEAMGGLRHLTNHPPGSSDLPPVRVGVSIGDSVAGLYAAFGLMAALWQRDRTSGDGVGRTLDVALTDSVLSLMEGMLPEYGVLGEVRQPTGSRIVTAAPSSAYPTKDGKWLLIAANSDPLFARLAQLMGKSELARDPRYIGNRERVANTEALDEIISSWTLQMTAADGDRLLSEEDIPCTQVYTAVECAADPQYRQRGMVREIEDPRLGTVLHPGIVPHIPENPGTVRWPGSAIGAHTEEILEQLIGMGGADIDTLRQEGVIS